MYRHIPSAPLSVLDAARRGRTVGRYCKACGAVYPALAPAHRGKPIYGRDHIAATCVHEGRRFDDGDWWEPAVEVLPAQSAPAA